MSLKTKKLVLVLAIFTPVIGTKKEIDEAVETAGVDKDSKKSEGEYPKNLTQIPCI